MKTIKRESPIKKILVLAIGVTLISFGAWGYIQRYQATHQSNLEIPTEVITHETDKPDETPPADACRNYTVEDELPRQIELPSVGVSGCIQRVGATKDNAIAVPTNIHLAGWYTGSVLPGQSGVSIIDGHVLGRYDDAIFARLDEVKQDEEIRIQFGDKSWKTFTVVSVDSYTVKQADKEQHRALPGVEKQLTLITCGGVYDQSSKTYDRRVIARATLVE